MLSRVPLAMIRIAAHKTSENEHLKVAMMLPFSVEPFKFTALVMEHLDKCETLSDEPQREGN